MFFLLHFLVGAFSSTFCAPLFPSEALRFSAGDFCVLTVTAFAAFNSFLPFLHSVCIFALVFSLLLFLVLLVVSSLLGQVSLRLGVVSGLEGFCWPLVFYVGWGFFFGVESRVFGMDILMV